MNKVLVLVALICLINYGASFAYGRPYNPNSTSEEKITYKDSLVKKVLFSDILLLESGERIKLIAIDVPHSRYSPEFRWYSDSTGKDYGKLSLIFDSAFEFVKGLTEGKPVKIEFGRSKTAKKEGILAYVYLPDGSMLNAEFIRQGYSDFHTSYQNTRYDPIFTQCLKEAKEKKLMLWEEPLKNP
jgi:endonuclease YncB( thermonuclease family)